MISINSNTFVDVVLLFYHTTKIQTGNTISAAILNYSDEVVQIVKKQRHSSKRHEQFKK